MPGVDELPKPIPPLPWMTRVRLLVGKLVALAINGAIVIAVLMFAGCLVVLLSMALTSAGFSFG